jgi:hypothetical protein
LPQKQDAKRAGEKFREKAYSDTAMKSLWSPVDDFCTFVVSGSYMAVTIR